MTTHHFISTSVGNKKVCSVGPGPNTNSPFQIGLYPYMLAFEAWDSAAIISAWNTANEPSITAIKATDAGNGVVNFTHQTVGEDFELTLLNGDGSAGGTSATWSFGFAPAPGGGHIQLSDGTHTTGNINWNATPATFVTNIQNAINALTGYTAGDVVVSYNALSQRYVLDFSNGKFKGLEVSGWTIDSSGLTGGNAVATISGVQDGNAGQSEVINISFPAYGTHTELVNEIQQLVTTATAGSFTITLPGYGTTSSLPYTAGRSAIKAALESLVGIGNTIVTGGPLTLPPSSSTSNVNATETDNFSFDKEGGTPTAFATNPATALVSDYDAAGGSYALDATVTTHTSGLPGTNQKIRFVCASNPTGTAGFFTYKVVTARGYVYKGSPWSAANIIANPQGWFDILFGVGNTLVTGSFTDLTNGVIVEFVGGFKASMTIGWTFSIFHTIDGTEGHTPVTPSVTETVIQTPLAGQNAVQYFTLNTPPPDGTTTIISDQFGNTIATGTWNSGVYDWSGPNVALLFNSAINGGHSNGYNYVDFPAPSFLSLDYPDALSGSSASGSAGWSTAHRMEITFQSHGFQDGAQGLFTLSSFQPSENIDARAGYRLTLPIDTTNYTLNSATLTLNPAGPPSVDTTVTITAQKDTNPSVPANAAAAFSATQTTATATATFPAGSATPQTIDVTAIVAELIAQGGWANGNHTIFNVSCNADNTGVTLTQTASLTTNVTAISYTHNPVTIQFIGPVGGQNLSQMTCAGTATVAPSTIQDGGTATVNNILGGTWALVVGTLGVVTNIPYNVSAATLQAMINGVFGAGACTVTGGPAPGTALVITFAGPLANEPLSIQTISSLQGHFGSSIEQSLVRSAIPEPQALNVWDMTIIPGADTLAVSPPGTLDTYLNIVISEPVTATSGTPTSINVPLQNINAERLEEAINESFGKDVVRVTRVVHSLEYALIGSTAVYAGVDTAPLHFWYYRDVFRLVFVNDYKNSGTINSIAVTLPHPDPVNWMTQPTTDVEDFFPEALRTYLGFYNSYHNSAPTQLFSCGQQTNKVQNNLSYKVKFQNKYPLAPDSPATEIRVGVARKLGDTKVVFQWCRGMYANTHGEGISNFVMCETIPLPWDATPEQIQDAIIAMQPGVFGPGNIKVTGTLHNSWLSESTIDDPDINKAYSDLHIDIVGRLNGLPMNEFGYSFQAVLLNSPFVPIQGTDQIRGFFLRIEEFSKPLPGYQDQRNRFVLENPASVTNMSLTIDSGAPINFTTSTTVGELQNLIDAAIGFIPDTPQPEGGTPWSDDGFPMPHRYRHPVIVYGTDMTEPVELEFTGYGMQFVNHTLTFGVAVASDVILVAVTTPGITPVSEIQSLVISGNPSSGNYTVHGSGNITYNADAPTIQTAIGAAPPTVSGTYPNFLLTWPPSSGNVGLYATTSALNNAAGGGSISQDQHGGSQATFIFTEVVKGKGPKYADNGANYDTGLEPGCGDTIIIDDNTNAMSFGVDRTAQAQVSSIGGSQFTYVRRRVVFPNELKVQLNKISGTLPAGLTDQNYYRIKNGDTHGSFTLADPDTNTPITITDAGAGEFEFRVTGLTISSYARGSTQFGLPNRRSSGSLEHLPRFFKAGITSIELGIEAGDGISLGRFDTVNLPCAAVIDRTSSPDSTVVSAVEFLFNNAASTLVATSGNVGIAVYSGETSSLDTILMQSEATVSVGNVTLAGNFTNNGGTLRMLKGFVQGQFQQQ